MRTKGVVKKLVFTLAVVAVLVLVFSVMYLYLNPSQNVGIGKNSGITYPSISYGTYFGFKSPPKVLESINSFNDAVNEAVFKFKYDYPNDRSITFEIEELAKDEISLRFYGTGIDSEGTAKEIDETILLKIKITDEQFIKNKRYFKKL